MKFNATKEESVVIYDIVKRSRREGVSYDRLTMIMDLEAVHCNGNPMDFNELLMAPRPDFIHDIQGIRHNIDRQTGKLQNCFSPRYSKRKQDNPEPLDTVRRCRVCGCTDDDCRQCIEKTGEPCYWVEEDLCSACAGK